MPCCCAWRLEAKEHFSEHAVMQYWAIVTPIPSHPSGPTCSQSWVQRLKAANTQILGTFYNVVLGLAPSKDTRTLGHSKVNAVSFLFPIVSLTSELGGWRGRQKGTVCSSSASRAAAEVELLTHSFSSFPAAARLNATILHKNKAELALFHGLKRHHHYPGAPIQDLGFGSKTRYKGKI